MRLPLNRCALFLAGLLVVASSAAEARATERCAGQTFPLLTAPGGLSPYIALEADGVSGAFQLDYGSTRSSLSRTAFGGQAADISDHDIQSFSLPTFARGRFQLARYGLLREPAGGQVGIVGTDFLSKLTADFSFDDGGGDVVLGFAACDPQVMSRRGMVSISQSGFFSSRAGQVRTDMPNVPVLPLRIGAVAVWGQVDTGYDDAAFPPSIDINEALYRRLIAEGVSLASIGHVTVTTCHGRQEREIFDAPGGAVAIVRDDGSVIQKINKVRFVRKGAGGCGGIGDMSVPAAQLGVSVLRQLGSVVFDPKAELVWLPDRGRRGGN